jgi:hypothetical protein
LQYASLDHLVGAGEEGLRHGEAERVGCLQIDDQLEFGRSMNREVCRLCSIEDLSGVAAKAVIDGIRLPP